MTRARFLTALALTTLFAVAALGCARKKMLSLTASPKSVSGKDYKLTIEKVEQCRVDDALASLQPGNIALGVEVTFEGTTAEEVSLDHTKLRITDRDGHNFKWLLTGTCKPEINASAPVKQGVHYRGFITFEVPEKANGLTFIAQPARRNFKSTAEMFDDEAKIELR
jgi:Domain of unknown function (DUF4352)